MPFPYELYPKAKETHCLNLPEISVSRPPFPGSIRTVDGCLWGWRDNNSYADTTITASDGTSYKYGTVFTEKTTKGEGIACSSYANCYIGCSCNTSNGWYSTCQGSDCKSATDNHYTGVNSLSAGKSISDVASISASGANSGISASAAAKSGLKTASAAGNYTATAASAAVATAGATSGISTMASGATTCYKKKTCSEGGYYDSVPADQKCSSKSYNGYSCYTGCSYKTCSDYGYNSSIPSGKTCETVHPRSGLTCYKDCKDDTYYKVDFRFLIQPCQSSISWEQRIVFEVKMVNQMDDHDVYSFSDQIDCTTAGSDYGFTFHMRAGTYITKEFSIYVSGSNLRPNIDNVSGSVRAPLQGDSFEIDSKFSNSGYYYVYSLTWP